MLRAPRHNRILAMLLTFAACCGSGALAGTSLETVTITGQRQATAEMSEGFVSAHAVTTRVHHIPRWHLPVCPATIGLPDAYNAFVTARILAVAKQAGAPTAAACKTNIEVVFTTEPQKVLDDVRAHRPKMLGVYFVPEEKRVTTIRHPIQAWYATATRRDGRDFLDDAYKPAPPAALGSLLSDGYKSVFENVLIIVDAKTLAGKPIGPVADYVTMLALTEPHLTDACGPMPSIIDRAADCAGRDPPAALTAADLAYLKALYDVRLGSYLEKSLIAFEMLQQLQKR